MLEQERELNVDKDVGYIVYTKQRYRVEKGKD